MAIFFENGIGQGKTFLLYGNINERFFGPDLVERDFEQYLVKMLKSRGYRHIVFYGQPGNKGEYCLDPESARFFFSENKGIPLPSRINIAGTAGEETGRAEGQPASETPAEEAAQSEPESGSRAASGSGGLRSMMRRSRQRRRGGYTPGSLSEDTVDTEDRSRSAESRAGDQEGQSQEAGPAKIRYALRSREAAEFFLDIHQKMLDPESKMAVVLYDLFVMPVLEIPSLRDDILSIWDSQKNDNLCLILAPQTVSNTEAMIQSIRSMGLGPKFLIPEENGRYRMNPLTCFNIPNPGTDEIRNMLRRLMIVGIPGTGHLVFDKKLRIKDSELGKVADEIQYCSSVYAGAHASGQGNCTGNTIRGSSAEIYARLCNYLRKKAKNEAGQKNVELGVEEVAGIWNMERVNRESALEQLNRPGWESAYKEIKEVIEIMESNYERSKKDRRPAAEEPDPVDKWSMDRMRIQEKADPDRMIIPNFILLGNPGVGKSTIARLIGNLLHETGCLKKGHTVEVTREQLTSSYVAGIPKATRTQIDLAEEGVLFIDEAHALGNEDGGVNRGPTGLEVIQTLNGAITDPRRHFCVIMAGYEDQMKKVYKLDPGFFGRFRGNVIVIEDYRPELLEKILRDRIRELNCELDSELTQEAEGKPSPLQNMLRRMYRERNRRTFENARAMITLGNNVCGRAKDRPVCREDFLDSTIRSDWFEEEDVDCSFDAIMRDLDESFVGMDRFKEYFRDLHLEIREKIIRGMNPHDIPLKPLLIVGNPGAGKTTVAKKLAKLYYSYQMLGSPEPDFVSASALIGTAVGESQDKVLSHIHDAQDIRGMFVIDEAHEFLDSSYGSGAIGACMEPTTDTDHPFMLVMNIYSDKEKAFLAANGGILSRFTVIRLEDYKPEELLEICRRLLVKNGYTLERKAADRLRDLCRQTYYNRNTDTGNGRWCNNVFDSIVRSARRRCHENGIEVDSEQYYTIVPEDIPVPDTVTDLSALMPLFKDCRTKEEKLAYLRDIEMRLEQERIGAAPVKKILKTIIQSMTFNVLYPQKAKAICPGHYFFKGNAGTGKTTGAEYLAKYLHALGLIESAGIRKLSATDLIGQYLGETGVKTRKQLMESRHHVTLVDEAYALADRNGHADSYKKEALAELVAFLDDPVYRMDTTYIFAGYNGDMDVLYSSNQGLRSRVIEVEFADFTDQECIQIFRSMAREDEYGIEEEAEPVLEYAVRKLRQIMDFSNGRTVRTFYEAVSAKARERCIREQYEEDDERVSLILKEDIEAVISPV